jgi:ABC-type branched-subunit amino acid transport system ATPase component
LEIAGLCKSFGGVRAVSDLSFSVDGGAALGIIGPNGAGKSTLLKLIGGLLRPDSGTIKSDGHLISGRSTHLVARSGVVLAHQIPRPFQSLSVRDNISVGWRRHGARSADSILDLCGLSPRAATPARSLGLLDLKRLEVARALATNPSVLLLDEVAAGLNGRDLDHAIELVADIHRNGTTVVVVEHIERVIRELVDRVLVLDWGQLIADGTPAEIAAHPEVRRVYIGVAGAGQGRSGGAAPRSAPVVELRGVSARYGDVQALKDVDVTVGVGEVVAVLGANGAGKSTLASVMSGHIRASAGSISAFGADVTDWESHLRARRGISHCPEGRHVFSDLTVAENLGVSIPPRTTSGDTRQRLKAVHDLFPILEERASQPAGTLSGGEQQMLSIGRALMADPKLLICDELSLGLAPLVTKSIYDALRLIAERGVTLVLIEQDVGRCLDIADWVYVLLRGRVSYAGAPGALHDESFLDNVYFGKDSIL